ncbi:McrB family protein [Myroides marinus]|uniref:McrB family protein n=1 Tax=Myroides marinus TaxID=703342 RepID=UPI00257897A1|nr:AAA family ATPase [Myroides marinus]MDM1376699.1 AAA family ATPase [Myroides marinus]
MRIFFGKISDKYDKNQITERYYEAPKQSSWFNGLDINDYAYVIGGGIIQLWKAREWKKSDQERDRLYFDLINPDLQITIEQFVSFKHFYLDIPLIIKTTRPTASEEKAFFELQTEQYDINDFSLFNDTANYRKIYLKENKSNLEVNSKDIQLYFEEQILKIAPILFSDNALNDKFNGSTIDSLGKGSKNKDKVIRTILLNKEQPKLLDDLKIQQIYDTFMCKYNEKKKNERNYWVVNGHDIDKIEYDIENNLFVMQQQYNEQHNSTVSGLLNKCKQIKEGDGVLLFQNNYYYAYGEFKKVDFETANVSTIDKMRAEMLTFPEQLVSFTDATCYFENTNSDNGFNGSFGQRFLIEQWNGVSSTGKYIPGLASETSVVYTTIKKLNDHKFYDKVVQILEGNDFHLIQEKMENLHTLLKHKKQLILQGPPGTGKTYTAKNLAEYILTENVSANKKEQSEILKLNNHFEIIQFHPAYTYEDFIRGIVTEPLGDKINYVSKDKLFLELVKKANQDKQNPYVLIIDEINRANLSAVLGELIYALEYRDESFKTMYADKEDNYEISIPENLLIIGTMNTADRSVGHLDYALRRRFAFFNVLPTIDESDDFDKALFKKVSSLFVKEIKNNVDELEAAEHLSLEFSDRPQDIWLGHSYFFKQKDQDFNLRIQYEIVPILQEYVKDGILNNSDKVKEIIKEIINYN